MKRLMALVFVAVLATIAYAAPRAHAQTTDLTGLWQDDTNNGATYRVRQIGSQFYWNVDNTANGGYVNVYVGTINGTTITGGWVDMPGSPTLPGGGLFGGSMNLRIDSSNHLVILMDSEAPCCYGGKELFRQSGGTSGTPGPTSSPPPSSGPAQACNWSGTWTWVETGDTFALTQAGNQVSGVDSGTKISGTVAGNHWTGTWMYGSDFGDIDATMDSTCNKFTGKFGGNKYGGLSGVLNTKPFTGIRQSGPPPSGTTSGGGTSSAGASTGGQPIDWTADATNHASDTGKRYTYSCPPNGSLQQIWGTDIYTYDSPICTAAVHAGVITVATGGTVTIEIVGGQNSYPASTRNGVASSDYGSWDGSYRFIR